MERYDAAAHLASRQLTARFSDSFSQASRLFPAAMRQAIYDIYGLVRVADEIADTYDGPDRLAQLDAFEAETMVALKRGFSSNIIIHAFQLTARPNGIGAELLAPFFASMRIDIEDSYTSSQYQSYIYGSAEVVGLMCLRVFVHGDDGRYAALAPGAKALGAALQKTNFLRDLADDHERLGRFYFPDGSFEAFDEPAKRRIITDIKADFATSLPAIRRLPRSARPAVMTAYRYYSTLLERLEATPASTLTRWRIRLPRQRKLTILAGTILRERWRA